MEPRGGSDETFAAYLASEFPKRAKVAREVNIRMD